MIETAILTPQGLHPTPYQAESLANAAVHEPEGVYTITRTFKTDHALLLDAHLDRLAQSAELESIPLVLDRAKLRAALRELILRGGYSDSRFRITVPRSAPTDLYLAMEPLPIIPSSVRENGVFVATITTQRHNPNAKTTVWMIERQKVTQDLSADIYQAILVNEDGELLEGTSSNFYTVMNETLYTANDGILSGISRKALLQVAASMLPVQLTPCQLNQIPQISEAFLTSSSRGVIPIVKINNTVIGSGVPGAYTRQLMAAYDQWTDDHLEPI